MKSNAVAVAVTASFFNCGARAPSGSPARSVPLEPCSQQWADAVGADVVREMWTYSVNKSPDFMPWLLAVTWQESHMDPRAKSPAGAVGMLQLTTQGALEASLTCDLPELPTPKAMGTLLDSRKAITYGSCLLNKYLKEVGGNWGAALILYNGGYRQLVSYLGQGRMAAETQDYVRDVLYMRYACGPIHHTTKE